MKKFLMAIALFIGLTSFASAQVHHPVHHRRVVHHHRAVHHPVHHSVHHSVHHTVHHPAPHR